MNRMTNFARATAAVCGAFLLLGPAKTQADGPFRDGPFRIRAIWEVGEDEDLPSDPSIPFELDDDEIFYIAFTVLGPLGLLCAIADFEENNPFVHLRLTDPGSFAPLSVTARGHGAVRVNVNGVFFAMELAASTDPNKLDLIPRSAGFSVMSERSGSPWTRGFFSARETAALVALVRSSYRRSARRFPIRLLITRACTTPSTRPPRTNFSATTSSPHFWMTTRAGFGASHTTACPRRS